MKLYELIAGINRNIVECKVAQATVDSVKFASINRNIVECKDDIRVHLF